MASRAFLLSLVAVCMLSKHAHAVNTTWVTANNLSYICSSSLVQTGVPNDNLHCAQADQPSALAPPGGSQTSVTCTTGTVQCLAFASAGSVGGACGAGDFKEDPGGNYIFIPQTIFQTYMFGKTTFNLTINGSTLFGEDISSSWTGKNSENAKVKVLAYCSTSSPSPAPFVPVPAPVPAPAPAPSSPTGSSTTRTSTVVTVSFTGTVTTAASTNVESAITTYVKGKDSGATVTFAWTGLVGRRGAERSLKASSSVAVTITATAGVAAATEADLDSSSSALSSSVTSASGTSIASTSSSFSTTVAAAAGLAASVLIAIIIVVVVVVLGSIIGGVLCCFCCGVACFKASQTKPDDTTTVVVAKEPEV